MKKSIRSSQLKLKNINVKQTKLEERAAPRMAIAVQDYEGGGGSYTPPGEPTAPTTTGFGLNQPVVYPTGQDNNFTPSRTYTAALSIRRY